MAIQQDFLDDEKEKDPAAAKAVGPEGTTLSGGAAAASAPSAASEPAKRGSGFTNLDTYVNANKESAAGMADTITGGLTKDIDAAKGRADTLKSTALETAKQNTTPLNQDYASLLRTTPTAATSPQWEGVHKTQTQGYKGPKDITGFQGYADLSSAFPKLEQRTAGLSTPEGVTQEIKNQIVPPAQRYTAGEQALDSFLVGSGGGAASLDKFRKGSAATTLPGYFNAASAAGNQALTDAATTSNQTATDIAAAQKTGQDYLTKAAADAAEKARKETEEAAMKKAAPVAVRPPAAPPPQPAKEIPKTFNVKQFKPNNVLDGINIAGEVPAGPPINIAPTDALLTPEEKKEKARLREIDEFLAYNNGGR